jgi:predicted DNA-binding ribbon-helix-helix protein
LSGPVKRSITIAGHRTSVSLEPVFWSLLSEAAETEGKSIGGLVTTIDESRTANLSSAIRTWLVERLRAETGALSRSG